VVIRKDLSFKFFNPVDRFAVAWFDHQSLHPDSGIPKKINLTQQPELTEHKLLTVVADYSLK